MKEAGKKFSDTTTLFSARRKDTSGGHSQLNARFLFWWWGLQWLPEAEAQFEKMLAEGAINGRYRGESTRPNHLPISVDEEINRVLPFLQRIRQRPIV